MLVVLAGWAIFRAASLDDVRLMALSLAHWASAGVPDPAGSWKWVAFHVVPWLAILPVVGRQGEEADIAKLPAWALALVYWVMFTLVITSSNQRAEFIYFQF